MPKGTCSVDGCDRDAIAKTWCDRHYRIAQRNNGDPLAPPKRQGRTPCSAQPCEGFSDRQGMCSKHRSRFLKGQPLHATTREVRGGDEQCAVDDCEDDRVSKGFCDKHYRRWLAHGDPHIKLVGGNPPSGPCAIDDCGGKVVGWGLCDRHYRKFMQYGDPLHVQQRNVTWEYADHPLGCRVLRIVDTKDVKYEVLYDVEDEEIAQGYRWYINAGGYAVTPHKKDEPALFMSRLILGLEPYDGMMGDHIDGQRRNNRRYNLRVADAQLNQQNKAIVNDLGSSKYRGVHWDSSRHLWAASVKTDGVYHHLGRYVSEDLAGAVVARFREQNGIWPGWGASN